MKNNVLKTMVVLVLGIALGVGGYLLVDKYIVDEEKNEETINIGKTIETKDVYTLDELNKKINEKCRYLKTDRNSYLASKYSITTKINISSDNFINTYLETKSGKELEPVYTNWWIAQNFSQEEFLKILSTMVDDNTLDYCPIMANNDILLDEIHDTNSNNDYLIIALGDYSKYVYIYDKNYNLIGNFNTTEGGLYYPNDINKSILRYNEKIEIHEDYILSLEALDDSNSVFGIIKYDVENGQLVKTIEKRFAQGEVECAGCK